MATYVIPQDTETDPDAPLKSELGKRWDNNLIAFSEGAADAPRMTYKIYRGTRDDTSDLNYTIPSGYSGAQIFIKLSSGASMEIRLSDDGGATFGASSEISANLGSPDGIVYIDFATGNYIGQHSNSVGVQGTVDNAGANVTNIRFNMVGTGSSAIIIHWNGGAAA